MKYQFTISFDYVVLLSNNTQEEWKLQTDVTISNATAPAVTYSPDGANYYPLSPYTWGPWSGFTSDVGEDTGITPPSSFNGSRFTFHVTDGSDTTQFSGIASGIEQIPLSNNIEIQNGLNPTVSWHNSGVLDYYRIRVLDNNGQFLWESGNLNYNIYGSDPEYTIDGYDFLPGAEHLIRIEARKYSLRFQEIIGDYPDDGEGITNRSTSVAPYSNPVPEPSTMFLLGTGLIGLAGWGRKKFKKN